MSLFSIFVFIFIFGRLILICFISVVIWIHSAIPLGTLFSLLSLCSGEIGVSVPPCCDLPSPPPQEEGPLPSYPPTAQECPNLSTKKAMQTKLG